MAYSVTQLITRAYYLSQIVARGLQTVSGDQLNDGLYLLNALLEAKGSDLALIPYFTRYPFNTVVNQEEYFIENLLFIETMTFNLDTVRFSMNDLSRSEYFGSSRVNGISSLPFDWHAERFLKGMKIYLYFLPQAIYQVQLMGKFGLSDVSLNTDLSTIYDLYYIEYLRYALAEYLCSDWGVNFPDQAAQKYKEIVKKLTYISPADLTVRKTSTLQTTNNGWTFADANFGKGWRPQNR